MTFFNNKSLIVCIKLYTIGLLFMSFLNDGNALKNIFITFHIDLTLILIF